MVKIKMKKNIKRCANGKLHLLKVVAFLMGFQMALALYILSSFLKERSGIGNIGIFYVISYIASFYVMINLHHLIKRHGKSTMFLMFLVIKIIALFGMGLFFESSIAVVFAVWSLMSGALAWVGLDLLIENYSKDKVTGSIRGAYLAVMNAGVLIAPFLATWIVENMGYRFVFFFAANITAIAAVIILMFFRKVNHNIKKSISAKEVFKKILKKKNLSRIYYVSFLLELFYAVAVVYTPLYLRQLGVSWVEIGIIFTVMLVPFVILQYPLGVLADKKTGEKEWLLAAIVLTAIFTATIGFINSRDIIVWMGVLFMTRVGAAIIEVMRESYFYKQVGPADVDLIDFFRTTRSVAYVVGMAFFSFVLFFCPIQFVFVILALILLTGLVPLWKLKDTH